MRDEAGWSAWPDSVRLTEKIMREADNGVK